jgi:hypothetical protein
VDRSLADEIATAYMRWATDGDPSVKTLFSLDFVDHVSGRRGLEIFDIVANWLDASFADRRIEHHATAMEGERVLVWYTQHGRHVGNGFPRLAGLRVAGAEVAWPQLHVFRVEDALAVEHWAVRDDYSLVEQIKATDAESAPA